MNKTRKIPALALTIFVFLFMVSAPVIAEEETEDEEKPAFSFSAGVAADGIYDSNVFKLAFNEEDDLYFTIQPSATLSVAISAFTIDLSYQPQFVFLSNNFQNDAVDSIIQNLQFISTIFSTEYMQLELRDHLGATKTVFSRPDTPDNLSLENTVNPRLIFTYDFTPRINSELLAEFFRTDIQDPGEDFYKTAFGITSTYEMTPSLGIIGQGYAYQSVYDSFFIGDHYGLEGKGGFIVKLYDRYSGKFLAGYERLILPGVNDSNFNYSIDLSALLTELSLFTASFAEGFGTDLTGNSVKETKFSGTFKQQLGPRTTFAIEGNHNIYKIPNSSPFKDRTVGAGAEIIYEITESFKARGRYEFDQNLGPRSDNNFTDHRFTLGLEYDFGELFNIF